MCTSLTYTTTDGYHFLARNMDFGFQLDGRPTIIPRNYEWQRQLGGSQKFRYGFVGTGRDLNGYILADGVNEKGVAIAELYFLNEAEYQTESLEGKLNLAPHEFIMWVLGEIADIAELKIRIQEVNIVHAEINLLGTAAPLHFIVTDRSPFGHISIIASIYMRII